VRALYDSKAASYAPPNAFAYPAGAASFGSFGAYEVWSVVYSPEQPMYLAGNTSDTSCTWWMGSTL
jgi:hypothetical protein